MILAKVGIHDERETLMDVKLSKAVERNWGLCESFNRSQSFR